MASLSPHSQDDICAGIAAATSSEHNPSEELFDPTENYDDSSSDDNAPIRQSAKAQGRGRSQPRGRAARGASSRGASTKAIIGRGKAPPPGSSTGRGLPRGRGRIRRAPVRPGEEALQKDLEPSASLPAPEQARPPPKSAVGVLLKKGKQPRLEDEIAEEASIMEVAAPVVRPKAKRARRQLARITETLNEEESADPVSKTVAATMGDQAAASHSISPENSSAEATQALETLISGATPEGGQQIAAAPVSDRARQPSKSRLKSQQVQQPEDDAPAVVMQVPDGKSLGVRTEHFVRRSMRNCKPALDSLLHDQPAFEVEVESNALGQATAIQPSDIQAQQKGSNFQRLGSEPLVAPARTLKSAKALHDQPDPVLLAAPASRTASGSQPALGTSKPRGGGRGRGKGLGRPKKPTSRPAHLEEAIVPIAGIASAAQTALRASQAEPEEVNAQAEKVQPQPAAELPVIPQKPKLPPPGESETQPAQSIPKQASKKAPKLAAEKMGKKAEGSKRKAAQQAANVGPSQVCHPL